MKHTLLILPCNAGAMEGNYYLKSLWKRVDNRLKQEGLREQVDMAAIDCLIMVNNIDNLGGIVREDEMQRVKGFDAHPGDFFIPNSELLEKFNKFVKNVEIGLLRFEKEYETIAIFSNVVSYRQALIKAVNNLQLMHKTKILDWDVCGCGIGNILIDELMNMIKSDKFGLIRIEDRKVYKWKSEENRDMMLKRYKQIVDKFYN